MRPLIQSDCVLTRKGNLDTQRDTRETQAQRKDHVRDREKVAICKPRREALEEANPDNALLLDFSPLKLRDNKFLVIEPPSLWYLLWQPQQTNTTKNVYFDVLLI